MRKLVAIGIVVLVIAAILGVLIVRGTRGEKYIEQETADGTFADFPNMQGEPNVMLDDKYEGGGPGGIGFMDWDVSDDIRQDRPLNVGGQYSGVT